VSKRLFVSFDFDHDRVLKNFVIGQSKLPDSPFSVVDLSLKEAAPEPTWEAKARVAIGRSDVVMVMLGPHTRLAQGVLKEVAMAREQGIPCFQIIGYQSGGASWAVPNAGRVYAWSWDNLKKLLA
jgi:hypothetical protein